MKNEGTDDLEARIGSTNTAQPSVAAAMEFSGEPSAAKLIRESCGTPFATEVLSVD